MGTFWPLGCDRKFAKKLLGEASLPLVWAQGKEVLSSNLSILLCEDMRFEAAVAIMQP